MELNDGVNSVSIISQGRESINVEELKTSSTINGTIIDDTEFRDFFNKAKQNALNQNEGLVTRSTSTFSTSSEIYDYALNFNSTYTFNLSLPDMEPGEQVTFTTTCNIPHVIELTCPQAMVYYGAEGYSWAASGTTSASLHVVLPNWWGKYTVRVRALNPNQSGVANLTYVDNWSGDISTKKYENIIVAGGVIPMSQTLSGTNYFIGHTATGVGLWDRLALITSNPGKIMAGSSYKKVYPNPNNPYVYHNYSAYMNYNGHVSHGLVSTSHSTIPSNIIDVYMGLEFSSASVRAYFPNLPANNSFKSGHATSNYNCISWTVERTDYWEWPGNRGSSYYNNNLLTAFDNLYRAYGYTRSGATAENAGIALWATSSSVSSITHASVRKNANTTKPHGFDWESKCGQLERVMHERDALNGSSYGEIYYYYRPNSNTRSISQSNLESENIDIASVSQLNTSLKTYIPTKNVSNFEAKYIAWKNTWNNTELSIHSNPQMYAQSKEYYELLDVCKKLGKASWPLFIEKLTSGDILVINLVSDLTFSENANLMEEVKATSIKTRTPDSPQPSMYSNYVNYCKKLLSQNSVEIQNAIYKIK